MQKASPIVFPPDTFCEGFVVGEKSEIQSIFFIRNKPLFKLPTHFDLLFLLQTQMTFPFMIPGNGLCRADFHACLLQGRRRSPRMCQARYETLLRAGRGSAGNGTADALGIDLLRDELSALLQLNSRLTSEVLP